VKAMPRGDGTGSQELGSGRDQKRLGRSEFGRNYPFQKSTLGGTLFAFASMIIGNWLDKKLSKKKERDKSEQDESN